MDRDNPYIAPQTEPDPGLEWHEPRSLGFGRGAVWLSEGFTYFKREPGAWIMTTVVGFVIMVALSVLPLVNIVSSLLNYVFLGGLILGIKAQDNGDGFSVAYLFAGFKKHFVPLFLLALLSFVITVLSIVLAIGLVLGSYSIQLTDITGIVTTMSSDITMLLLVVLIVIALLLPLFMAMWFAPALIVLHEIALLHAMKLSFIACIKNMLPFLLYGILGLLLMIVAAIPLFLGYLLIIPLFLGSIFVSYRDIFVD